MVTKAEMREAFGLSEFCTLDEAVATQLNLPATSKLFLATVGFPRAGPLTMEFDFTNAKLPTLAEYGNLNGLVVPHEALHLRRIGTDGGAEICIDERVNGTVVSIDLTGTDIFRFVNTSIEQFGEALVVFKRLLSASVDGTASGRVARAQDFRHEIRRLDPQTGENPDSWWMVVCEQMIDGNL